MIISSFIIRARPFISAVDRCDCRCAFVPLVAIDPSLSLTRTRVLKVGEHLLSLLQNLEPFANSDAFQDAAEAMEGLHVLTEPAWR